MTCLGSRLGMPTGTASRAVAVFGSRWNLVARRKRGRTLSRFVRVAGLQPLWVKLRRRQAVKDASPHGRSRSCIRTIIDISLME